MKSLVTRQKYQKRLEKFFDFLELAGHTIEEKSTLFIKLSNEKDNAWIFNIVLKFMQILLERFNKRNHWLNDKKLSKEYKVISRNSRYTDRMEENFSRITTC